MRVLDLDLDFFLTDVCELAAPGERPPAGGAKPWPEAAVRAFLEENCGLSRARPVPGRVFPTHDGALWLWRDRLAAGKLTAPFDVTHIDAHSDLGIGRPGPAYVLETVLARPPEARVDLERYAREEKLDEANYLLFALAFRWAASLTNVRSPRSRPDLPPAIVAPDGESAGAPDSASAAGRAAPRALRLTSTLSRLLPRYDFHEPRVPYRVVSDPAAFRAGGPFDLVSLAVSPRYAPAEADFIVDVFRPYFRPC